MAPNSHPGDFGSEAGGGQRQANAPRGRNAGKLICPGLSRTCTRSLAKALELLGLRVLHWAPERLRGVVLGETPAPCFRR